jgi:hypothetical protein
MILAYGCAHPPRNHIHQSQPRLIPPLLFSSVGFSLRQRKNTLQASISRLAGRIVLFAPTLRIS